MLLSLLQLFIAPLFMAQALELGQSVLAQCGERFYSAEVLSVIEPPEATRPNQYTVEFLNDTKMPRHCGDETFFERGPFVAEQGLKGREVVALTRVDILSDLQIFGRTTQIYRLNDVITVLCDQMSTQAKITDLSREGFVQLAFLSPERRPTCDGWHDFRPKLNK